MVIQMNKTRYKILPNPGHKEYNIYWKKYTSDGRWGIFGSKHKDLKFYNKNCVYFGDSNE